jgi:xanthine/CO dehydrogenase XdhC/CoxF family maturation factor
MFVRGNGWYECALSGGRLEPAEAEAASRVIATGKPVVVSYDLADDSVWRPPLDNLDERCRIFL